MFTNINTSGNDSHTLRSYRPIEKINLSNHTTELIPHLSNGLLTFNSPQDKTQNLYISIDSNELTSNNTYFTLSENSNYAYNIIFDDGKIIQLWWDASVDANYNEPGTGNKYW